MIKCGGGQPIKGREGVEFWALSLEDSTRNGAKAVFLPTAPPLLAGLLLEFRRLLLKFGVEPPHRASQPAWGSALTTILIWSFAAACRSKYTPILAAPCTRAHLRAMQPSAMLRTVRKVGSQQVRSLSAATALPKRRSRPFPRC